ncbi:methyltransferase domain-containing protein [Myxococcota bacterium]|nr:methyltransferase domain-containing protein [Myxococcota bacterium]MBU1429024.1 methyltransferase domain-containing protein [Myxococcota bacterium]MBU1898762.1 methyltransferase domain-containing protein [Myxococcota bacterium]
MNWWRSLYDEHLADLLLSRKDEVEATTRFLITTLGLRPGDRLFDQCCGNGRLARPLAAQGFELVGVDLIEGYVEAARRAAPTALFFADDAFTFMPPGRFDGAFNWWTSFGYAPEAAQNQEMLARAFEALKPGKRFALDFFNLPGLLRGFQPQMVNESPDGRTLLIRHSRLDLAGGRLLKRWRYVLPDGARVEHESAVQLYMPHDLAAMCRAVGFVDVALYGDLDGGALTLDSPRCLVVARRP